MTLTSRDALLESVARLGIISARLQDDNERLHGQFEQVCTNFNESVRQFDALWTQYEALRATNADMESQFDALTAQHEVLGEKYNELLAKNNELEYGAQVSRTCPTCSTQYLAPRAEMVESLYRWCGGYDGEVPDGGDVELRHGEL